jgi:hypothetical protein
MRYLTRNVDSLMRPGTVRICHIAAGPSGPEVLCGRRLNRPRELTGREASLRLQYLTCEDCARRQQVLDQQASARAQRAKTSAALVP